MVRAGVSRWLLARRRLVTNQICDWPRNKKESYTMKNRLMGFDVDDILELGGLRRRPSFVGLALPALGLLVVGAAIGVAFGLMVAPSSGRK